MNAKIIRLFTDSIDEVSKVFYDRPSNYFFTEKELHSYFYHLCLEKKLEYMDYNLVHTEYPTPFKCETLNDHPYIKKASHDSKKQRAHIDLVLLNPHFIEYVHGNVIHGQFRFICGLGGALFSDYIEDFYSLYKAFGQKYKESILLYSLEFKFQRHLYQGEKYPAKNLWQDINKLKLVKEFEICSGVKYCQNALSLIYIGERIGAETIKSLESIAAKNSDICKLYKKR